jgi:hypothetical protein
MLANNLLYSTAFAMLGQPNPQPRLLSRLSSLTLSAFLIAPESAKDGCGFILQLFYYLFEPTVLSLFETLCADNNRDPSIPDWLLSLSLPQTLYKEIEGLTPPRDCSRGSPEANRISGLFRVFAYCAKSPQLRPSFCTPACAEALCKYSGDYPDFVEDSRWEALAAIYGRETSELLGGMFHSAIQILQTGPRNVSRAGVAAIALLTQITKIDDLLRPFMSSEVIRVVLNLLLTNPNHSVLQAAAREFLGALLLHTKTRANAVREIVPQLLTVATATDNKNLAASLGEIMQTAANIGKTDVKIGAFLKDVPGFGEFVGGRLMQRNLVLNRSYGGPLPGRHSET